MTVELVTKQDLLTLMDEILDKVRLLLAVKNYDNEWLKTAEVRRLLKCSNGTLQNLRAQGKLKYAKVNGTVYYSRKELMQLFEQNP